jgi:hypothetical protein
MGKLILADPYKVFRFIRPVKQLPFRCADKDENHNGIGALQILAA